MKEALVVQIDDDYIYLMTDKMKMLKIERRNYVVVGERIAYGWYEQLPLKRLTKVFGVGLFVLLLSVILIEDVRHQEAEVYLPSENERIVGKINSTYPSVYYVKSPFEHGEMMKERQLISSELKIREVEENTESASEIDMKQVDEEKP